MALTVLKPYLAKPQRCEKPKTFHAKGRADRACQRAEQDILVHGVLAHKPAAERVTSAGGIHGFGGVNGDLVEGIAGFVVDQGALFAQFDGDDLAAIFAELPGGAG